MGGIGHQLLHSDAHSAELEALGLDSSLFGAAGVPAPIFQALEPRRAGVFDEHAHTFGTADEPAIFARASLGLYLNSSGQWAVAAANMPRPEYSEAGVFLGYLFEAASTNVFLNSAAAVTQDIALGTGTFTCSVHGSGSVTSSNGTGTASGHGAATDGAPNTIIVSGAGTITYTVSGSPTYVQVEELAVPSSPIITAGASATRAVDTLSWATRPAGFSNGEGMAVIDFAARYTAAQATAGNWGLLGLATFSSSVLFLREVSGTMQLRSSDGSTTAALSITGGLSARDMPYRAACGWSGSARWLAFKPIGGSWTTQTGYAYDGFFTATQTNVAMSHKLPICLKRAAIFNRDIGVSEFTRLW